MKKKKKYGIKRALSMILGFICALVLGGLFYGTMVYQLGGADGQPARAQATPALERQGTDAGVFFPGPLLSLDGELTQEEAQDVEVDGTVCRVVTRVYTLSGGVTARVVSAAPAVYLTHLAQEGFVPQLITGFSLAGLDAVCGLKDGRSLLAARDGDRVYLLEAQADEQTLYALGAGAALE